MFLLIGVLIFALLAAAVTIDGDRIAAFFTVAFVGCIIAFFGSIIVTESCTHHHWTVDATPNARWYPVSLSDNYGTYGEIHGGLFVISGFVATEQFYSWYEETPDGGLEANRVSERAGQVKVYEEPEGTRPVVEKFTVRDDCTDTSGYWSFLDCEDDLDESLYEIHVPEGTIVRQFQLDSK